MTKGVTWTEEILLGDFLFMVWFLIIRFSKFQLSKALYDVSKCILYSHPQSESALCIFVPLINLWAGDLQLLLLFVWSGVGLYHGVFCGRCWHTVIFAYAISSLTIIQNLFFKNYCLSLINNNMIILKDSN